MTELDEKLNEPVRPNEMGKNDAIGIGGLADEKRLRENEEALDAAYADEGEAEEPFIKKDAKKVHRENRRGPKSP